MVTLSGSAGVGVPVLRVAVGVVLRVGELVRVGVREPLPLGDGLVGLALFVPPDGPAEVVEAAGELDARDSPVDLISAGIAISAPITKNTAAMTTLGNCIAVLPAHRHFPAPG
jgi:hypothetical protein